MYASFCTVFFIQNEHINYDSLESLYGAPKVYAADLSSPDVKRGSGNLSGKRTELVVALILPYTLWRKVANRNIIGFFIYHFSFFIIFI